jgi:hypothetical protein
MEVSPGRSCAPFWNNCLSEACGSRQPNGEQFGPPQCRTFRITLSHVRPPPWCHDRRKKRPAVLSFGPWPLAACGAYKGEHKAPNTFFICTGGSNRDTGVRPPPCQTLCRRVFLFPWFIRCLDEAERGRVVMDGTAWGWWEQVTEMPLTTSRRSNGAKAIQKFASLDIKKSRQF